MPVHRPNPADEKKPVALRSVSRVIGNAMATSTRFAHHPGCSSEQPSILISRVAKPCHKTMQRLVLPSRCVISCDADRTVR